MSKRTIHERKKSAEETRAYKELIGSWHAILEASQEAGFRDEQQAMDFQEKRMRIESLRLKNFKSFKNAEMLDIPRFCVIVGANGSGKSTLFSVFEFLRDALVSNVHTALVKQGGNRGFREVRNHGAGNDEPIEIEIKFRENDASPLITYFLSISEHNGRPVVACEVLKYRRGSGDQPWHFLDFANGEGTVYG